MPVPEKPASPAVPGATTLSWSHGPTTSLPFEHLLDVIDARVAQTPHSVAVIGGPTALTFSELDIAANRLARTLVQAGVEPGAVVPLFVPRGAAFMVAVLAALKAGGGYMPMDLRSPPERNGAILARTGAAVVIAHADTAAAVPAGARILMVDGADVQSARAQPLDLPRSGGDLAYVINTSGSTGEPKSAAVAHRSFANLIDWYIGRLDLTPGDKVLIVGATTFDASQKNLFAPLLVGGTLVFPDGDRFDPEALAATIARHGITWINGTPSNVYPIVEGPGARDPSLLASLRWVVLGGEPIQPARLLPWLTHPTCRARVLNTYGPTECTDICAAHAFGAPEGDTPPPLGRAINNVTLAVVDEDGAQVAAGQSGELLIGGIGVGLGYVGRPDLNADAFARSTVFGTPQRVYRTGDRVRVGEDGVLHFVGRIDHQVKLHGFRLELGEVDAALCALSGVREGAAIVRRDLGTEPQLVGCLVPEGERQTDGELREALARRLPDYAVPTRFMWLDALPLSPNGKVDRCALEQLAPMPCAAPAPVAPDPNNGLEARIGSYWQAILGHQRFSPHDTFFDVGGTSLQLARLQAMLGTDLGRAVPIVTLFAHPTVARLASALEAGTRAPRSTGAAVTTAAAPPGADRAVRLRAVRRTR